MFQNRGCRCCRQLFSTELVSNLPKPGPLWLWAHMINPTWMTTQILLILSVEVQVILPLSVIGSHHRESIEWSTFYCTDCRPDVDITHDEPVLDEIGPLPVVPNDWPMCLGIDKTTGKSTRYSRARHGGHRDFPTEFWSLTKPANVPNLKDVTLVERLGEPLTDASPIFWARN